jgi:hypothetical protein
MFWAVMVSGHAQLVEEKSSPRLQHASSPAHQVVVLLDINPHQKKVLPVELALAKGIIERIDRPLRKERKTIHSFVLSAFI